MEDAIVFRDGDAEPAPLVIPEHVYAKIRHVAAQANIKAVELVQLVLTDAFTEPGVSLEALSQIVREMPKEL